VSEVIVVATFTARPGRGDSVAAGLQAAVAPTHNEDGCLLYALHQGIDDPETLVFVERWTSTEALAAHAAQPWVRGLSALAGDLVGRPRVETFRAVPAGDPDKGVV
jgi:quinol monooxygenase YgiN